MCDLDTLILLHLVPLKQILITLIKSRENAFQDNSHGSAEVIKVNQRSYQRHATYRVHRFWALFTT